MHKKKKIEKRAIQESGKAAQFDSNVRINTYTQIVKKILFFHKIQILALEEIALADYFN